MSEPFYVISFHDPEWQKQYQPRFVDYWSTPDLLLTARTLVATGAHYEHCRPDMAQWGTITRTASDVFLSVPHTGFCYHHRITHLLTEPLPPLL